jgi:hypothetical protein
VLTLHSFLRRLGHRARPLFRPDWDEERRTIAHIRQRLEQLDAVPAAVSRQSVEVERLGERIEAFVQRDARPLRAEVAELRRSILAHMRITGRALRRSEFLDEQAKQEEAVQRVVDRAHRTGRPVMVGPWTGEIGFELLYWIPFLRKLKTRLRDLPLTVMSRGGATAWYAGIAAQYQDIFALVDPAEFRAQTDLETRKQRAVGHFDRQLLRAASRALNLERPVIVHPSLMYNLLYPYWKDQLPPRQMAEYLEPALLTGEPSGGVPLNLPDDYVAVRFYFSKSFPDSPSNRALVDDVVRRIAARLPVVLLNTPFAVDDHVDAAATGPAVHSIASVLTPQDNLAVQTAVIRQARAFVGTYGGFSYLAPLCGVPSVTFYSEASFFEQHLEFARRTFAQVGAAPFVVLHERERVLVNDLLAPAGERAV